MQGISVVIPNYNGIDLLPQILPSVFTALQQTGRPYEVIVSDDCSTDDSVHFLALHFPDIYVISNQTNSGFSVTANHGIKSSRYNIVLLLNSDVKLQADYFLPQLKYFERPDTFGVMGRIIGWDDEAIQDGAKYPYFHGVKIKTAGNYLLKNEADMKCGLYSMYLSGANALLNKTHFMHCGGFNEIFAPFYVEDYELSLRAWRLGFKCYYEHFAICRHKTSVTIKAKSKKNSVEKIYNRNKMYLHAIHLDALQRFFYFLQLIPEIIARFVTGRWAYLRSLSLFIGSYKEVIRSRDELKSRAGETKLLSVREVADNILTSINRKSIMRF